MIGHAKITGIMEGKEIGRDDYGNPIYGPDTEQDYYGEFAPLNTDDLSEPNRDAIVIRYRIVLPSHSSVTAHDRVRINGAEYEVVGQPMPIFMNGRTHHYEFIVERFDG